MKFHKNFHKKAFTFILSSVISLSCSLSLETNASLYINLDKDPNGCGGITVADAVYILQYLAGSFEPKDLDQLDINDNGIISELDVDIINMYDAGVLSI